MRIVFPSATGEQELTVTTEKPFLRCFSPGKNASLGWLRGLVRLNRNPQDQVAKVAELCNLNATSLRAALPYLRARDISRRLRGGTVLSWLRRVHGLRAHAERKWRDFLEEVRNELDDVDLTTPWILLDDERAFFVDIAIAMAIRPHAILLEGCAHNIAAETQVVSLVKHRGVPLIWDGCSPATAASSEDPIASSIFSSTCLTHSMLVRKHAPMDSTVTNMRSSHLASLTVWARTLSLLVFSALLMQADAFGADGQLRAVVHAAMDALSGGGAVDVPWWRISTLIFVLGGIAAASVQLKLGIGMRLGVAAVRCFVQLGCLGLVLVPIIAGNNRLVVVGYLAFMMLVASAEAAGRPPYVYPRMFLVALVSLAGSVVAIGIYVFYVVIGTGLEAQYIIPILGMVMGSSLSGISVGVSSVVTSIAERKDGVEALLALGATRWEATREVLRTSVILGLTSILNQMAVTGLVSIPGKFLDCFWGTVVLRGAYIERRLSNRTMSCIGDVYRNDDW